MPDEAPGDSFAPSFWRELRIFLPQSHI